jgi:fatty-acyl-CoA synthase
VSDAIRPPFERYTSLVDPIVERLARAPAERALVLLADDGSERVVSRAELDGEARAAAAALRALGIGRGDVVVIVMGHSLGLIASFLGAIYQGAVPTIFPYLTEKLDPAIYAERVRALVSGAGARAVVTGAEFRPQMAGLLADLDCRIVSELAGAQPALDPAGVPTTSAQEPGPGPGGSAPATPAHEPAGPAGEAALDRVAYLQFTSGTSGMPKGVPQTHGALLRYVASGLAVDPFTTDDVIVSWLPLYHDLGLVTGLLIPLVLGVPTVLMSPFRWVRSPGVLFRAIHDYRGTMCWVPNFALNQCTRAVRDRDLEGVDLGHWKSLISGGEPVRADSQEQFRARFRPYGLRDHVLQSGYGMAENVCAATTTDRSRPPRVDWINTAALERDGRAVPVARDAPGAQSLVSCGAPFPGTEVRVVDERGRPLPARTVGEIVLRGRYLFSGYYRRPDLTSAALRDGWFQTGDLGYLADGELYVCGRKSDLIIVGGRNIQPDDLEALASGVAGVLPGRAVAFGVPDAREGTERVVVVCETRPQLDPAARGELVKTLRRRAAQELDVVVGTVHLVAKGWAVKTSNGKLARATNREKYLRERDGDRGGCDA